MSQARLSSPEHGPRGSRAFPYSPARGVYGIQPRFHGRGRATPPTPTERETS
jgi:hypothetical protein